MTDRHEPTISTLPVDREDGRTRVRGAGAPPPPPPPVSSRPVVKSSKTGIFGLLLALVALAVAGYTYSQLQQSRTALVQSEQTRQQLDERVRSLEQKLDVAGSESTQSLAALQANVRENASEIRKLWGVSNDRNKKAIEELKTTTAAMQKQLGTLDQGLQKRIGEVTADLKVLEDLIQGQQGAVSRADRFVTEQRQALESLTSKLNGIDSDLRRRVANNEEAIKSVDAFRAQVTQELMRLRGG